MECSLAQLISNFDLEVFYVVLGVILGFLLTVLWDKHKEHKRYKETVRLVLYELERNKERMDEVYNRLPEKIKDRFSLEKSSVQLTQEEIMSLAWSFPKPYVTDAWKTFVASGLVVQLPPESSEKLYKLYDQVNSINFLSNLSISLFQIVSNDNKLDKKTNENFDHFCRAGTLSLQVVARSLTEQAIVSLKKENK